LSDSSQKYSAAAYPLQKMLIWKFYRMVWTTYTVAEAPAPLWTILPERFIDLHPRLTNLTPRMIQTLGQGTTIDTINIVSIITKKMKPSWIQRGIRPETEGSRLRDPLVQPWTYIEQPGTPQQNNFKNTTETRLACGIYTVLSSLYAVRNWEIDFEQQTHIRQARNWMAAIGHALHVCYKEGEPADAHELLIAVINDISEPVLQIFQGQMASTVQCAHCDNITTTTAHTQDISLHIDADSNTSLREKLLNFFQPETLEGDNSYWCDTCLKHQDITLVCICRLVLNDM